MVDHGVWYPGTTRSFFTIHHARVPVPRPSPSPAAITLRRNRHLPRGVHHRNLSHPLIARVVFGHKCPPPADPVRSKINSSQANRELAILPFSTTVRPGISTTVPGGIDDSRLLDTRSYHLDVVQHPQRTAEFGSASLSRLPLAPPIVVQLIVRDRFGNVIIP